mmetsp:Transcript_32356/g.102861  ORF Transcript_32356/g.102861 Transcript_32356/m.102861 type:complete len:520 (-) Transcript_32356:91-1650(-)
MASQVMASGNFMERLAARCSEIDSLLCVGLDPHQAQLAVEAGDEATHCARHAAAAKAFCLRIVEATKDVAACYKPNSAFFERYGAPGMQALEEVIAAVAATGALSLLDNKRGDISTTADAYAHASYDVLRADAVTLNAYMGWDAVKPFCTGEYASKGAFVLCKTSNPSSNDFQVLPVGAGEALFEATARRTAAWNDGEARGSLGLVVGATDVDALRRARAAAGDNTWILAPGIGAQGGNLEEAVKAACNAQGMGLLVPVSRGISKAADPAAAARELRDNINAAKAAVLGKAAEATTDLLPYQREFIEFCLGENVLRFGEFTLKSGRTSPYFFNAGLFASGMAMAKLGKYYAAALVNSGIEFDCLFGPAYKGIPLVTAVGIALVNDFGMDVGLAYNRKEKKDHGEGGVLVGCSLQGKKTVIVDDVITGGTAIREALGILEAAEAVCAGVVIALDRQERTGGATPETLGDCSAVQAVQRDTGANVVHIIGLEQLFGYLQRGDDEALLGRITAYRSTYGVTS